MKPNEYFKFVIAKIEKDFRIYQSSEELAKIFILLEIIKNSKNLISDIYTISRVKNLGNIGNYLLFMLKKAESGEIKFDNLIENLDTDKQFIENELLSYFNIFSAQEKEPEVISIDKKEKETIKEKQVITEAKKILSNSPFKVEEIENELVTEEFIESELKDDTEILNNGYLELIKQPGFEQEESAFSLPTGKADSDVFSLPGENRNNATGKQTSGEENKSPAISKEKIEEILSKKEQGFSQQDKNEFNLIPEVESPEEEIIQEEDQKEVSLIPVEETQEEIEFGEDEKTEDVLIYEDIVETELVPEILQEGETETEIPEEEEKYAEEIPETETLEKEEILISESKKEDRTKREESPEPTEEETQQKKIEIENTVYMKYETELLTCNEDIRNDLEEILLSINSTEQDKEKINNTLKHIVERSSYMESYSQNMSFEIITGIYNVIHITFSNISEGNKFLPNEKLITLFKNSLNLVESLIKGEEFTGVDKIIKAISTVKENVLENKKQKEEEAKTTQEKYDLEKHLNIKYSDTNQKQKLLTLKENISEIEKIINSLNDIEGDFQAYEALRRLSHTFTRLKEIVSIANSLELRKLSQLSEGAYIFVKFIQNYRMDPFEKEIMDVFKYIVYNFKLIFLDKPTKDIDVFISYLNDPVKIFEKKEKK